MKNLNVPLHEETFADLKFISSFYESKLGVSLSQRETISKLLHETAMIIKNTGNIHPNRSWDLERMEEEMHRQYLDSRQVALF